jgi:plasmid stability protein
VEVFIMPSLSIKDVPEPLLEAIRRRAARHHRSLQGELMALISQAAAEEPGADIPADHSTKKPAVEPSKSFAEAAADFRRRFPSPPGSRSESSVDFIREMRDTHYGEAWVMAGIKDGHWPPQPGDSEPIPGIGLVHGRKPRAGNNKQ